MPNHVKRREPAAAGSIPAVLKMFESEVRFYREIAPVVGVRAHLQWPWLRPLGEGLVEVMPSTMVQGYLTMADYPDGSEVAAAWNARLGAASALLAAGRL